MSYSVLGRSPRRARRPVSPVFIGLLLLGASTAWAVDGVIEINQAKALAGGVTAADTPGFPVTIDAAGSYRLTGNLQVPNEEVHGLQVLADNVTIDLNGFSIQGTTTCTSSGDDGSTVSCSPLGSSVGVQIEAQGVRVTNGTLAGLGDTGVSCHLPGCGETAVDHIVARGNGNHGIRLTNSPNSRVDHVTVVGNGDYGIGLITGSRVADASVSENGSHGVFSASWSVVRTSFIRLNGGWGIFGSGAAAGNIMYLNAEGDFNGVTQVNPNSCGGTPTCP